MRLLSEICTSLSSFEFHTIQLIPIKQNKKAEEACYSVIRNYENNPNENDEIFDITSLLKTHTHTHTSNHPQNTPSSLRNVKFDCIVEHRTLTPNTPAEYKVILSNGKFRWMHASDIVTQLNVDKTVVTLCVNQLLNNTHTHNNNNSEINSNKDSLTDTVTNEIDAESNSSNTV